MARPYTDKEFIGERPINAVKLYRAQIAYFLIIFALLILWGVGVFILYRTVGGPTLAVTDRVEVFQSKMLRLLIMFGSVFFLVRTVQFVLGNHGKSLVKQISTSLTSNPFGLIRSLLYLGVGAASFLYIQVNFMSVKTAIPSIQPFYFGDLAASLDRLLFFGKDPWVYFSWLYDIPHAMKLIDVSYTLWSTLIVGFWIYAFTTNRISRQRRYQYIFSMIMMWFFAGNLLAILLSSAGPCYYHIFGTNPQYYAGLMEQLRTVHESVYIDAYSYQDVLLSMYNNPETRFGGISAAPSLHVGTSLLLLAFFWQSRLPRVLLIAFNIIIYVGSIVLAWHYAIDGLIVAPVAFGCWFIAGKLTHLIETKWPDASLKQNSR